MKKVEKVDNAALDVKIAVRDWCIEQLGGAAKCNVLDLYAGEGVMYDACYEECASHLAFDLRAIPRAGWLQGGSRILWQKHRTKPFNLIDADAYGSPWLILNDVMRDLLPVEKFAIAITDGSIRRLQIGNPEGHTRQVIGYAGLPPTGLLALWREDIVRWHIEAWAYYGVKITHAKQGRSKDTKVHYFGLVGSKT